MFNFKHTILKGCVDECRSQVSGSERTRILSLYMMFRISVN